MTRISITEQSSTASILSDTRSLMLTIALVSGLIALAIVAVVTSDANAATFERTPSVSAIAAPYTSGPCASGVRVVYEGYGESCR